MQRQVSWIAVSTLLISVVWLYGSSVFGRPADDVDTAQDAAGKDTAAQETVAQDATGAALRESMLPGNVTEARGRARLLHEMIHGALQVMHRDFFREDEGLKIPSKSLEDVFSELHGTYGVKVDWMAVNAEPMSIDHKPKDGFEKDAAGALATGEEVFDLVEGNSYRFAGRIRLASQCLKCHVPNRTSNKERAAAVVITIPLKKK